MMRMPLSVVAALSCLLPTLPAQTFPAPFRLPRGIAAAAQQPGGDEVKPEQIQGWVAELQHSSPLRVETALRQLIAAGPRGAEAVRPLCDHADPALALRARQVFGAVHGVPPEVHAQVTAGIARAAAQSWSTVEVAGQLQQLGDAAVDLATRLLAVEDGKTAPPLLAELTVRRSMGALAAGADHGDAARQAVLALSAAAAEPLWRAARDAGLSRDHRLHALWLYGVLGRAGRAAALTELAADRDAVVRGEALALLCEALRPDDFDAVAQRSRGLRGAEREALAAAAARVVPRENLERVLRGRPDHAGALAALALGHERSDAAREALAKVLGGNTSPAVAEAAATALGAFPGDDATKALVAAYAGNDAPGVRAAAVQSLRNRAASRAARIGLCAALFDADAAVRLLAAEALGASENKSAAPALILAAAQDDSGTLRARVTATLAHLLPEAAASAGGQQALWSRWLDRQSSDLHKDDLPWYRAAREAAGLVQGVRSRIESEFFHFGNQELVDPAKLNATAREALQKAVDDLLVQGDERALLQRLLQQHPAKAPEDVLAALGAIPFTAAQADLVRLTNAAAGAMVERLGDPYSRLTASNDADGKARPEWLPGILEDDANNGFMAKRDGDRVLVDFVLYDSPAWWAGLQRGDQLVRIGETFAHELKPKELREKLRVAGDFAVLRDGWNRPYTFHLVPDQSHHRRMVTGSMLPGGIGYVRLKMFELGCSSKIERAIADLEQQGMQALVLDLRNNPGGTVADATSIVDLFLPEGKLITVNETRSGADDTDEQEVKSTAKGKDRSYPVAVLVNECSASASEMTSGSLQGNGRAVVVGQTSFGKGIGQSGAVFPGFSSETSLGRTQSQYVLTLTMMRYYLPEGKRSIHGTGVQPDLPVRERNLKGSTLDKVMRALEHKAFGDYIAGLQADHAELCLELCRFDGGDAARYPGLDEVGQKLARFVDADELRRLVRERLRLDLLRDADEARFQQLCWDVQEDRTLRAAIQHLCDKAGIDPATVPEYGDLR